MGAGSKLMRMFSQPKWECPRCWKLVSAEAGFCPGCGVPRSEAPIEVDAEVVEVEAVEAVFHDAPPPPALTAGAPQPPAARCDKCSEPLVEGARYCASCGAAAPARRKGKTAPIGGFDVTISQRPRLAVLNADGTLRRAFPLTANLALIGRTEGDVLIERDPFVSPRHARLQKQGDDWVLEDLRTANGVYRKIDREAFLDAGDYFRAGRQLFRVTSYDAAFGTSPPPVPPSGGVSYFGSPGTQGRTLYVTEILENRRIGHILSFSPGAPRVVGREEGDLVFQRDEYLSGRHLRLQARDDGKCHLLDLDSTNGVYVRLTGPTPIKPGWLLSFGETLVRFEVA